MGADRPHASGVSAAAIRHLLHKRTLENAKASRKAIPKKRRRFTTGSATKSVDGAVKKKKRRKRRRRRRTTTVKNTPRPSPKKTSEIAIQTSDYPSDVECTELQDIKASTSSRKKVKMEQGMKTGPPAKENHPNKKIASSEGKRKPSDIADVITLSDDDNKPSTSGTRPVLRKRRSFFQVYESDEDSDFIPEDEDEPPKSKAKSKLKKKSTSKIIPTHVIAEPAPAATIEIDPNGISVADLLLVTPVAVAVTNNLPMRSLNALCQVNRYFRNICKQVKNFKQRKSIDWVHRPNFSTCLDVEKLLHEEALLGKRLSDIYCEPAFVFAFCSPRIMYSYRIHFESPRSLYQRQTKSLDEILSDLMPVEVRRNAPTGRPAVVHIRTHAVIPPVPPPLGGNVRKADRYGCRESTRDLCLLLIPHIPGVNIWREYMSDSDLRKQLKESGWLQNRARTHFLLPVIKDLEALGPKLVLIFSRRMASFENVLSKEFPVILLNTMDDSAADLVASDPLNNYGLEIVAFGGNLVAYQIVLLESSGHLERSAKLTRFRDQFTAGQVMEKQILLFVFRNVSRHDTGHHGDHTTLFENDIKQLREQFPRVPIFGGGYLNSIGSVFTKDQQNEEFGKFYTGLNSMVVCGLVFG